MENKLKIAIYMILSSFAFVNVSYGCGEKEIAINHSDIGPGCKLIEPALPQCLSLNTTYVLEGKKWLYGDEIRLLKRPMDPNKDSIEQKMRRKFITITDTRGHHEKYGILGVLASSKSKTDRQNSDVLLFQNISKYEKLHNFLHYQKYHQPLRVTLDTVVSKSWQDVKDYSGVRTGSQTRRQFFFDLLNDAGKYIRSSLILRFQAGGVACVNFDLAHSEHIEQSYITTFIDGYANSRSEIDLFHDYD